MLNQPTALAFLARELGQRHEVAHAVLSPGSRCAPLILAFAREESITAWSLIDERTAGFFALGLSKASGKPSILACTSGTAAAEYAPSVHEARESAVPLIVLTADRPPELRAAGENQTIDQIGVFGSAAKALEMPRFDSAAEEDWSKFAAQLLRACLFPYPGPVHINVPLWDPLNAAADVLPDFKSTVSSPGPTLAPDSELDPSVIAILNESSRPLLVLGRDESGQGSELAEWAAGRNIPCFADPLAGAPGPLASTTVAAWDAILRTTAVSSPADPDLILRSGDLPTSKPLRNWLAGLSAAGVPFIQSLSRTPERDPLWANTHRLALEFNSLSSTATESVDPDWTAYWAKASERAMAAVNRPESTPTGELDELRVISRLTHPDLKDSTLFIAASMPVRDLELCWPGQVGPRCVANRGANGIDGTLASAAGHSAATGSPTFVICGDVTFAHDLSGLAAVREASGPLTVIVIDNGGGAIFDNLAISSELDVYEKFILTPPRLDMQSAAATFGLEFLELRGPKDLEDLVNERHRSLPLIARLSTDGLAGRNARNELVAAVQRSLDS